MRLNLNSTPEKSNGPHTTKQHLPPQALHQADTTPAKSSMYSFMRISMVLAAVALLVAHSAQAATQTAAQAAAPAVRQDAQVLPTAVRANWYARCKSRRDTCYTVARAMASSRQPNPTCVYNACCSCYYACNRSRRFTYRKDCLNVKRAWAQGSCSKSSASWRAGC